MTMICARCGKELSTAANDFEVSFLGDFMCRRTPMQAHYRLPGCKPKAISPWAKRAEARTLPVKEYDF